MNALMINNLQGVMSCFNETLNHMKTEEHQYSLKQSKSYLQGMVGVLFISNAITLAEHDTLTHQIQKACTAGMARSVVSVFEGRISPLADVRGSNYL